MNSPWRALSLRLGLGLLAFSALFFYRPLEDAYVLPQRMGLSLAALGLLAAPGDLPWGWGLGLGLAWFAWRTFCHAAAGWGPASPSWLGWEAALLALYLGAARGLTDAPARRFFAAALMTALGLGAVYALLAPLGLDPFAAAALDLGFGRRAYGSLGNPDFLGGWLALLLPLAVGLGLTLRGPRRAAAAGVALLAAVALWQTQARASWLAGAVGVGVGLAVLRVGSRTAWKVAGLGLLLGLGVLALARPSALTRLRDSFNRRGGAWQSRELMTELSLDLAREHPYLGVGPGHFTDAFLAAQAPLLAQDRSLPYRFTADAHDDWAQAAAEGGWLGLALWAALLWGALGLAWCRGGLAGAALAGGLSALVVQSCFHFPLAIAPTEALAVTGLGLAAPWATPRRRAWPAGLGLALGGALLLGLVLLGRQCVASDSLNRGSSLAGAEALPWLTQAARLVPWDVRAWTRLGRAQLGAGQLAPAQASYRRALDCLPHLSEAWAGLALAQGMAGDLGGAEASGRQAVRWDPRSAEAWSNLAKVLYLRGDHARAEAVARQGLDQAPDSAGAWFNLGGMLYNDGRLRQAEAPLRRALRLQPGYPQAAALLARCRHAR